MIQSEVVVPHIDTMASFVTVVILLNDVEEQDQLTLYNGNMDQLGSAVQTTGDAQGWRGLRISNRRTPRCSWGCLKGARPVYHQHIFLSKLSHIHTVLVRR